MSRRRVIGFAPALAAGGGAVSVATAACGVGQPPAQSQTAVMGTVTFQSKLYALPYQVFTELLYYNEDLLKREGQLIPTKDWTWDKLLEVSKAITRPGSEGRPGQWGIVLGLGNFRGLALPIMWANGGKLFDDDANPRSLAVDPAGAEGLQWLADMYTKHRVVAQAADATAAGLANPNAMVAAGMVGFNYSSLTWRGYRQHTFKSDVQMLPRGKARAASSTWGGCLAMPSTTKAPDAALSLMTHISGPAGQELMIPVVDQFPSVESIATSKEWLQFDRFNRQAAVDMIKLAKPTPPSPAWPDINSQALSPLYADLINGRKSALDGLREIKPKVDDLLRTLEVRPESPFSVAFQAFCGSSLSGAASRRTAKSHFPARLLV